MVFGELLLKENNKDRLYKKAMSIGLAGLIASVACALLNGLDLRRFYALADGIYYKQDFYSFLFTISLILAELSLAYFIFKKVTDTVPGRFISFCAVN